MTAIRSIKLKVNSEEDFSEIIVLLISSPHFCSFPQGQPRPKYKPYLTVSASGTIMVSSSDRHYENCVNPEFVFKEGALIPEDPSVRSTTSGEQVELRPEVSHDISLCKKYASKATHALFNSKEFDLPFEEFKDIVLRPACEYTGEIFKDHTEVTLERINPDIGYTKDNTIAVTTFANSLKEHIFDRPLRTKFGGDFDKTLDTCSAIYDSIRRFKKKETPIEDTKVSLGDTVLVPGQGRTFKVKGMNLLKDGSISYKVVSIERYPIEATVREVKLLKEGK